MTANIPDRQPAHHAMACKPRLEGEVIRTSGFCWICDSWFTDTWVLHYRARAATGGWAFCECWHLIEQEVLPLAVPDPSHKRPLSCRRT